MPQEASVVGCNSVGEGENDPFRATLLWGKIVSHLEKSIKCGRHTQSLRSYANCFQGSKAVDCLLAHLQKVLPKMVKRQQVQTLCQKLVLTGVIEDVKDREKGVFREGRLYRLTRNHFWEYPEEVSIIFLSVMQLLFSFLYAIFKTVYFCVQKKLPRTRSAEEICTTEKESDVDNLKGYASDSTVGHDEPRPLHRKKRRCKEREPESHHLKEYKVSTVGLRPPGMVRIKSTSTGSIYRAPPENVLSSSLGESRESLLPDAKQHRRKISSHRKPPKLDTRHKPMMLHLRRGSVDSGTPPYHQRKGSMDTLAPSARAGSISPSKPPLHSKKLKHAGKERERTFRSRQMSRSLKGERERTPSASKEEGGGGGGGGDVVKKNLNRSHSFSSVDDYDHGPAACTSTSPEGAVFEDDCIPESPTLSGSKWIVYGFL